MEEIGNINWTLLINSKHDIQTKFNIFYETIKEIYNTCQPIKEFKIKADQKWMTPDIKAEIKLRQKLHKEKKHEEWK